MLHLKLHTTSTTGHVVVTVISVGHWQFCRRVFATGLILLPLDLAFVLILSGWVALRAALGGFWQELPHASKHVHAKVTKKSWNSFPANTNARFETLLSLF